MYSTCIFCDRPLGRNEVIEAFLQETWGKGRPEPGASIGWVRTRDWKGASVASMSPVASIALEMALHEEQERRALEGELVELRAAWRNAEEMAQISDNLLIPDEIEDKVASYKTASSKAASSKDGEGGE